MKPFPRQAAPTAVSRIPMQALALACALALGAPVLHAAGSKAQAGAASAPVASKAASAGRSAASKPTAAASAAAQAASSAQAFTPGTEATPPSSTKDVVLDSVPAPTDGGRIVPTPAQNANSAAPAASASSATRAARFATPVHDAATSGALAELGLDLLRQQSASAGQSQVNAVVSPVSLSSALGLLHAGVDATSANEIAGLLGSASAGNAIFAKRLPSVLDRLAETGGTTGAFTIANRVWVDQAVAPKLSGAYAAMVSDRYNAQGVVMPIASKPQAARTSINEWISAQTAKRIPELLPEGSVTANTKVVLTNAIHFKSKWAEPFDRDQTVAKPFGVGAARKAVPTMVSVRSVRTGVVDNIQVVEVPFAGEEFVLLIGMPPSGHTLNALENDLEGVDMASWSQQLKSRRCSLELPKFALAAKGRSLKATLQALGVKTVFSDSADFGPMLGKAGKGLAVDDVFQSASIEIDETGGEAAAATGIAITSKSMALPVQSCAVDRPFIFAVVHKATGAPLFVGKIADPSAS